MSLGIQKPRPRLLDKRAIAATKSLQWQKVRRFVLKRDGACRACKRGGRALEAHHVLFRSLGGKDEARNLIALCKRCHEDVHGHVLVIRCDDDGNPARTVRFERVR